MQKPSRTLIAGFLGAAAALVLFAWLADQVLRGQTMAFDAGVRNAVHAWASPYLTYAMRGFTFLGSPVCVIGIAALVVWQLVSAGRRRAAALLVVATCGAEGLDQILKLLFHRQRPEAFFGIADPITYSFPSGHAITAACFYGVLAAILTVRSSSLLAKAGLWTLAAVMAASIGFSRVYLGVHYPSDVLAGYAAAVVWVGAVRAGYFVWLRRAARLNRLAAGQYPPAPGRHLHGHPAPPR